MRINLTSIFVNDQARALAFYTDTLGFVKAQDLPAGPYRWISVRSPEGGDTQLSLEPDANPIARTFQQALMSQGIPAIAFETDDIDGEVTRLRGRGVLFTKEPVDMGPVRLAVFADTCGNLVQIYQIQK